MIAWITTILSLLALIISILGFFLNKRTLLTEVITKQRIEWISNVRASITTFVSACLYEECEAAMLEAKARVELYLNQNNTEHLLLIEAMDNCIAVRENAKANINQVILAGQFVMNQSWKRMKRESGMSYRFEKIRDKGIL